MVKVLVTGGSGFIGTSLVECLHRQGHQVLSLDVAEPQDPSHAPLFRRVDILDRPALQAAMAEFQPAFVVHLAAHVDVFARSLDEYRANTEGTENVVEALRAVPSVQRALFASTKLVVPAGYRQRHVEDYCPDTLYGQSKVITEQIVRRSGLACQWAIVRPSSIWGPWRGTCYTQFFLTVYRGRYVHPGKCDPPKSFGFVGNTCHQIRCLLEAPAEAVNGGTFYLSDYEVFTIRQWADEIARQTTGRKIRTAPAWAIKLAARAGDLLQKAGVKRVPMTSFRLKNMWTDTTHVDLEPMKKIVPSLPHTLQDGVRLTVGWLKDQGLVR